MKRLVLLNAGGTITMRRGDGGVLAPDASAADLLAEMPVLSRVADIALETVFHLDSGDMQPAHWRVLARAVHAALSDPAVDGVVVLHGTDTMAYTASAVALMLGPLPKPVVFTGAQRPLAEARTDARRNLADACFLATLPAPEVGVAFAGRLWRGVRVVKRDAWSFDAFASPACPALVDLGLGEAMGTHVRGPAPLAPFDERLDPRVLAVRVFPGLDPGVLRHALDAGVRGLLLEGYGTGNLPTRDGSLIPAINEAHERGVPVVVVSQCPRGAVELSRYEGGAAAHAAGAISGGEMTVEAALAKLMIGLGRHHDLDAIRAYFEADAVGERNETGRRLLSPS
ncbi:MAG: asparaginase [Polyangiaceae bacterium]|nr:asparaginase [Polyangiaceae bacterium]